MAKERLLRTGEIAALFGISARTIRYYEKRGILRAESVHPVTGYRAFSEGQVAALKAVLELKELGFTLAEIREILERYEDKAYLLSLFREKKERQLSRQDRLRALKEECGAVMENLRLSKAGDLAALSEEDRAWRLAKLTAHMMSDAEITLSEALWL